jgi:1,4-dihydroxy-2-naphthoate octaprenyltransferase
MSARSVITLLRFPYGLFLSPVALFALVAVVPLDPLRSLLVLVAVHLFLYPASNGFNSFFDHDRGPIGGLARPPRPTIGLLRASLLLDLGALVIGFVVSPWLAGGLLFYGLASKAYSWDRIRLKARPIASLLLIVLGQGAFTYLLVAWWAGSVPVLPAGVGLHSGDSLWLKGRAVADFLGPVGVLFGNKLLFGAVVTTLFLAGIYPLSQVYQHEEDARRGDLTYSRLVGLRGTFVSSALFLGLAAAGFAAFFWYFDSWFSMVVFLACVAPALLVFLLWLRAVRRDPSKASYTWMMRFNVAVVLGLDIFLVLALVGLPHLAVA